jgi:DNA (cytosine-5)-methyltransferase 1
VRYISLFSGIEAATVGWHDMGWNPVAFADFDEFPSAVLAHHYPNVPNAGDVLKHDWPQYKGKADLIVGGSPCQSFSHAGKRLGMDDPRGNLALHYLRIVRDIQPKWFIYENVPGLLSSNGGEDFATFIGEMVKLGYGFAYRVLDAQYFGVPQRRRRVFVVGCADGDWRSAAAVLFDEKSLCGDLASSKPKRQGSPLFSQASVGNEGGELERGRGIVHCEKVGPTMTSSGPPYSRTGNERVEHEALVVQKTMFENHASDARIKEVDVCPTLRARLGTGGGNVPLVKEEIGFSHTQGLDCQPSTKHFPTLRAEGGGMAVSIPIHDKATRFRGGGNSRNNDGAGNGLGVGDETDPMYSLTTSDQHMVFQEEQNGIGIDLFNQEETGEVHVPLRTAQGHGAPAAMQNHIVRRLTPTECERLQGFPDNYTQIPWKGKPAEECPSSHRYKALGNSMAVPVMRWIGERIDMLNSADLSNRSKSKTTKQMKLW